ncbi:MAG: hypothetical protein NT027_00380 [Proteobacteria bacterium]|nr:hypothetical protein [Pseudomonadota bacterium]
MSENEFLDLSLTPQSFFRERINSASQQLNVNLNDDVEFYLVNLLIEFINPKTVNEDFQGDVLSTPLVLLLKQIVEAPEAKQAGMYRRLGDTSLYITGFFQDYFNQKTFDINYFIMMGSSAYHQASILSNSKDANHSSTLSELSNKFIQFVDVVAQASDSTSTYKASDILNIYDRWNRCGSDRLRAILQEFGITPISAPYKIAQ